MRTEEQNAEPFFLDDWPLVKIPKDSQIITSDIKKWRFQQILANYPWGIPSLMFIETYKSIFGRDLDPEEMGFRDLPSMVTSMKDIFTVQQPDEVTAVIFPDQPYDIVLHDARLMHNFESTGDYSRIVDSSRVDYESLIAEAAINRDQEFPPDVVLAGETYREFVLPQTLSSIPNTRGVHQAVIIGAANPNMFFVHINTEYRKQINSLSFELAKYFESIKNPRDTHIVPDEFLYPGFPCAVYFRKSDSWERCIISEKPLRGNKYLVESADFGIITPVNRMDIFLLPRVFFEIPKQAIQVSLLGVTPAADNRYSAGAGARLRCFSNLDYIVDCLIVEPRKTSTQETSGDETPSAGGPLSSKARKFAADRGTKRFKTKAQFEAIVCDRNDPVLDIYLDEVLNMETYTSYNPDLVETLECLREQFKQVLAAIPRPVNPLKEIEI